MRLKPFQMTRTCKKGCKSNSACGTKCECCSQHIVPMVAHRSAWSLIKERVATMAGRINPGKVH